MNKLIAEIGKKYIITYPGALFGIEAELESIDARQNCRLRFKPTEKMIAFREFIAGMKHGGSHPDNGVDFSTGETWCVTLCTSWIREV